MSLDGAVMAAKRAVEISRDENEDQALYIRNLAAALGHQYGASGDEKDLDEAISTMQHVAGSVGAENRYGALESLLGFQKLSLEKASDANRLGEAISARHLLLEEVDEAEQVVELLYGMRDLYEMRLEHCQMVEHLDKCRGLPRYHGSNTDRRRREIRDYAQHQRILH